MWPLFGSTFFYVKNVFDARIQNNGSGGGGGGGDCILAINKLGVYFLNKDTHVTILIFKTKLINHFFYFKIYKK